jgi:NitT/TauT family transport system substrate-binding protein
MAKQQTQGLSTRELWDALYKQWPADQGSSTDGVRIKLPFLVDATAKAHIGASAAFLNNIHAIGSPQLTPGAVDDAVAVKALGGAQAPGAIEAQK